MTALAANRELDHYVDQVLREYPVEASEHIFKNGFVALSASGHAQALTAGDVFLGIAYEEADNSAGADGDKKVRVYQQGDFEHTLASVARTDISAAVYATDDGTLTLTSTDNSYVGRVVDVVATDTIILRIEVFNPTP